MASIDPRLEMLRSAPLDKWIALSEDESKIVAVGATYAEAVKNSEQAGVEEPVILKTPPRWAPLSVWSTLKPLKIEYKAFPNDVSGSIYSAMLNVQVALPAPQSPRTKRFEAIIDSGASRCLFHADIGSFLGIDIKKCPVEVTQGIGGDCDTYLHDLTLYIPGGPVTIKAGFKENLPAAGLLGMEGFFDHFIVVFDPTAKACELTRLFQA
jgi:hypothetical protein